MSSLYNLIDAPRYTTSVHNVPVGVGRWRTIGRSREHRRSCWVRWTMCCSNTGTFWNLVCFCRTPPAPTICCTRSWTFDAPSETWQTAGKNSCNVSLVQWIFDNNEFLALIFDTNYFWTTFGTFFIWDIWFWQLLIGKEHLQLKFVALTWGFPKGCCTNERRPRCWFHPPCCGYVACHSRRRHHHLEIKIVNQRRIVNRNENVVNPKINILSKVNICPK